MILRANYRISTRGDDGELITYNKGELLETSEEEGLRLILSKAAEYEEESVLNESNSGEDNVVYLSEAELSKMKKAELVKYATSLGLTLDDTDKQPNLVNAILDFISEEQELRD